MDALGQIYSEIKELNSAQRKVFLAIPVLLVGGTEIQTVNLVKVLLSAGYQVVVCCYYEYDDSMVAKVEKTGAKVLLIELRRSESLLKLIIKLRALFMKVRPDPVFQVDGFAYVNHFTLSVFMQINARLGGQVFQDLLNFG